MMKKSAAALAESGPSPLGVHLIMGESAAEKLQNVMKNLENDCIIPVQMIASRSVG